jgi:hypothetical protein
MLIGTLLVCAAGCSGHSAAHTATRLTVTYATGSGNRLGTCPTGAACSVTTTRLNPSLPIRVARFTLRCDPAGGTYPHPRRACIVMAGYVALARHPQPNGCACPGSAYPDRVVGHFRGRRVRLSLSACAACGDGYASADAAALMPRM